MNFTDVIDNAKRFAGKKKDGEYFDDLLIDRLHNRYTVAILVCFFVALTTYEYIGKKNNKGSKFKKNTDIFLIGEPIKCWVPAQLDENYGEYIDRLCYIQNTYHVAKHRSIPQDKNIRHERTLKYYQWINLVLLIQALFFSLPRIIWQSFNNKIGLAIRNLVDASNKCQSFNIDENRNESMSYIT